MCVPYSSQYYVFHGTCFYLGLIWLVGLVYHPLTLTIYWDDRGLWLWNLWGLEDSPLHITACCMTATELKIWVEMSLLHMLIWESRKNILSYIIWESRKTAAANFGQKELVSTFPHVDLRLRNFNNLTPLKYVLPFPLWQVVTHWCSLVIPTGLLPWLYLNKDLSSPCGYPFPELMQFLLAKKCFWLFSFHEFLSFM